MGIDGRGLSAMLESDRSNETRDVRWYGGDVGRSLDREAHSPVDGGA
jgi:hypothetical protein